MAKEIIKLTEYWHFQSYQATWDVTKEQYPVHNPPC